MKFILSRWELLYKFPNEMQPSITITVSAGKEIINNFPPASFNRVQKNHPSDENVSIQRVYRM
jgi:hypothetical protein